MWILDGTGPLLLHHVDTLASRHDSRGAGLLLLGLAGGENHRSGRPLAAHHL